MAEHPRSPAELAQAIRQVAEKDTDECINGFGLFIGARL